MLDISKQELDYLIKSIEHFGGTLNDSKLELNGVTITYHLANIEKFRIRKITIDLLENIKTKQQQKNICRK